jgi:hypothetical protein
VTSAISNTPIKTLAAFKFSLMNLSMNPAILLISSKMWISYETDSTIHPYQGLYTLIKGLKHHTRTDNINSLFVRRLLPE